MLTALPNNPLGVRQFNKLLKVGFRPVSRTALVLAHVHLFNPAARVRYVMPNRPLDLISTVPADAGQLFLSLSVNTALPKIERAAASIGIVFYSVFGRKLITETSDIHPLFADPIDQTVPQNVYLTVPKDAFWIKVTLRRRTRTRRIGFAGSLRPVPVEKDVTVALEEALRSSDRRALEYHLALARQRADREVAKKLLARLIYLYRAPHDIKCLRLIDDTEQTLVALSGAPDEPADQATFRYDKPFSTPYSGSMPLSKWLKNEAISLNAMVQDTSVEVSAGQYFALCLMAARYAGKKIMVARNATSPDIDIPWIKIDEILSIHALT